MYAFCTKAQTLSYLYEHQKEIDAEVLPVVYFTVDEWRSDAHAVYERVHNEKFATPRIICRSSARGEDTAESSGAGKFSSFICDADEASFRKAVESVIASYGMASGDDEVLVQPALESVSMAGVAFTVEPNTGGHYIIINYDDETGSTSSITDGTSDGAKLFCYAKGSTTPDDRRLSSLIATLSYMEQLFQTEALDVEFAFDEGTLYILQARPLVMKHELTDIDEQGKSLRRIAAKVAGENRKKPFLYGDRVIYSVMSDWNPAEMIGIHPHPLALSLYKEIITDNVWAYQRHNYGYQNLRSFPLMVDFCGLPYIDVRVSFNSFIPATLSPATAEKLASYYLARLAESPDKHDKIEFEIIFSCYTLDLPRRIRVLAKYGFTDSEIDEIIEALRVLTNRITNSRTGLWKKDAEKIETLKARYETIVSSDMSDVAKMYWLLEDCKRYGTLPFAGLARAAFIAVQILRSMVDENIISVNEYNAFMNDLVTISGEMKRDIKTLSRKDFLLRYGHLRPGTYDITSPRYDEAPDLYFSNDDKERDGTSPDDESESPSRFRLSLPQLSVIREALKSHGLEDDVLGLFSFVRAAIEGRESSKFVFTKSLSETLRLFKHWGEALGFAADDLSYADIGIIEKLYQSTPDEREILRESIEAGRKRYNEGEGLVLPPIITSEKDVESFFVPDSVPTFVTRGKVTGETHVIDIATDGTAMELSGRIAVIPAADPGYDWIFSRGIIGFVTEYGGANSHMAIRAGELNIPAVIGAGKKLFDKVKNASVVEIDAAARKVRILR